MDVCTQCYPTREVENASTDVSNLRNEGRTLLRCAIQNEHKACVDGLIKAGADVKDKGGACSCSPFITAVLEDEVECCAAILKAGADVNEVFWQWVHRIVLCCYVWSSRKYDPFSIKIQN